jgi:primosomal protein N' (replication factor Y) (superfamily II helicase)
MMRLEVAVAAPLGQTLTYLYRPEEHGLPDGDLVGKRVLVPLGKRRVTGYVLGKSPDEDIGYVLKPVLDILDSKPLFHANVVDFFRWIARYYHFPLGEVIKTALPAGLSAGSVKKIQLTDLGHKNFAHWPEKSDPPFWFVDLVKKGSLTTFVCRKIFKDKAQKKILTKLIHLGYVTVSEHLQTDSVREKQEVCYRLDSGIEFPGDILELDPAAVMIFRERLEQAKGLRVKKAEAKAIYILGILRNISKSEMVPQRDLTKCYPGAGSVIQGLIDKKILVRTTNRIYRNPLGDQLAHFPRPDVLSAEQETAVEKITSALGREEFHAFLLHGVTGSGKTEVYLRAAEKTLESGKDVLVLVPEIALATQLESHFVSRFGELVVLLHSGLSTGERFDQWSLAASGRARIVIGARSAVFAPLLHPGLIVVDEEHDPGYKQDDTLRYHGRDVAVLRARTHDAVVVLGSATPSVTSYYHAMTGKYSLLQMSKRVAGRALPKVSIVDLRKRPAGKRSQGVFSNELLEALRDTLERKEQSLLLMNRRGFSSTVLCQECGTSVECRHCHVSLVYHKDRQRLVCHYCGYNLTHKLVCSKCLSDNLVPIGFGTERIEEEIHSRFPIARVARLDSDTAADRKKFLQILRAMHRREIDILVGTQMIAKGHHFPHVTLVGAVWADGGLNMPDFRAAERTFQLISQATGRAGRGENPGRVIVQTMQPDHYSIVFARDHRYEDLYKHEIKIRKMPLFPPFVRLIAFLIHGPDESDVRETALRLATCCREGLGAISFPNEKRRFRPEVLGPAPAPLDRLCDQFRWQVLLKGPLVEDLHGVCREVMGKIRKITVGLARISIDVDPENMM